MIDDVPICFFLDAIEFAGGRSIDRVEQRRERIAKTEAAPTAVTDVEYTLEFFEERLPVVEVRILPVDRVTRRRIETPFTRACRRFFVVHGTQTITWA